jgi:methyl-accepting chemotaxis protein
MQVADEIGLAVLPLIDQLADNISQIIPIVTAKIKNFTDAWKNLGPELQKNILIGIGVIAVLGPLFIVIGKVIGAVKTFIAVFKILSIALLTNPIYLVIAGITLLVVALVRAFQTSNTFRQGVAKLGNIFIWFAEQALNYVIGYLNLWLKGINLILRGLRVLGIDVKEIGEIAPIAIKRLSFATVEAGKDVAELSDETAGLGTTLAKDLNPNLETTNDELDKTTDKATKTKDALKKMKEQAKEAAQIIVDKLEESLRSAESQLDNAKKCLRKLQKRNKRSGHRNSKLRQSIRTRKFH